MARAALLLLMLVLPIAGAVPSASVFAYAGSSCDDNALCGAQHAWSFTVCAGDVDALTQWTVVANDVIVSAGYWLLGPDECLHDAGSGTNPLVDCVLIQVTLTPTAVGAPLHAEDFDCASSLAIE